MQEKIQFRIGFLLTFSQVFNKNYFFKKEAFLSFFIAQS